MNKDANEPTETIYIETPRVVTQPVKLDTVLEQRMKEFLLSRRRIEWIEKGR